MARVAGGPGIVQDQAVAWVAPLGGAREGFRGSGRMAVLKTERPNGPPASLVPRVKVWLEVGGRYAVGLGISEILLAVGRTGSIKQAAVEVGMSYRHVWERVKEAEEALGLALVETQIGGKGVRRSRLTPEAHRLAESFLTFRRRMMEVVNEEFARYF
jgi:molybdate transport system regulatory protein